MKDEQLLEEQFRRLAEYVDPSAGLPDRVMQRVRWLAEKTGRSEALALPWRWGMQTTSRFAASLTALAAVTLFLFLWLSPSQLASRIAFADVQEAMGRIESAIVTLKSPEHPWHNNRVFYRRGISRTRTEYMNEVAVVLKDLRQGKDLFLDPRNKLAQIRPASDYVADPTRNVGGFSSLEVFLDEFTRLQDDAVRPLGEREFDGRRLVGFAMPVNQTDRNQQMSRTLWVDPETRWPARYEYLPSVKGNLAADSRRFFLTFRFNEPIDDGLFEWSIPKDYAVLDPDELRNWVCDVPTPPDTEAIRAMVVEPLAGVGPVRFGMGVGEVIDVLGPPNYILEHWDLTPEEERQDDTIAKQTIELDRLRRQDNYQGPKDRERAQRREELWAQRPCYRRPHDGYIMQYHNVAIDLTIRNDGGLFRIACQPAVAPWKSFWGRTTKGIELGATREEIVQAHGAPDLDGVDEDGWGMLFYVSSAMSFDLFDGRLRSIMLESDPESGGYDKILQGQKGSQ